MKNLVIGTCLGLIIAVWGSFYYVQTIKPLQNFATPTSISPTVTAAPSANDLLKTAFSQKYNIPVSDINITIKEGTTNFASGTVSLKDGGGWFLAVKENEIWKIVQDGNGNIDCQLVAPYNFPSSMVPDCQPKK